MIDANLENVVRLFRDGKITKYVLEKEFTNAAEHNVPVTVEISDTNHGFIIATIPERSGKNFSVKYLIDLNAITTILTAEEVVSVFYAEVRNTQKILSTYVKFLNTRRGMDIYPSEAAVLFLEMYKISVATLPEALAEKAREAGLTLSTMKLDDAILVLERGAEKPSRVFEELVVTKAIPSEFIDAAQKLAIGSKEVLDPTTFTGDTLNKNLSFNHTKEFANTFGTRSSQEIDHDYKPGTNQ